MPDGRQYIENSPYASQPTNPMQAAAQSVPQPGAQAPVSMPNTLPMGAGGQPSSQQTPFGPLGAADAQTLRTYSPMADPSGPLAHAGWIGALMANGPTRQERDLALQRQQQSALGQLRTQVYQTLAPMVSQQGMTPQAAFIKLLNTPLGAKFMAKDPNPAEAIKEFMGLAVPDPGLALAQKILGPDSPLAGGTGAQPAPGGAPPAPAAGPGTPQGAAAISGPGPVVSGTPGAPASMSVGGNPPSNMTSPTPVAQQAPPPTNAQGGTAPVTGQQAPVQVQNPRNGQPLILPPDVSRADYYLRAGQAFAALGGPENAKRADEMLNIAQQLAQQEGSQYTEKMKEYRLAVQQGTQEDFTTWLRKNNQSSVMQGPDAERIAHLEFSKQADTAAATKVYELRNQMSQMGPALDEAKRLAVSVPGGVAGTVSPYLAQISSALGLQPKKNWTDAEALLSINQLLLPLVKLPGSVSDYEQQHYSMSVPGLAQSQQGRLKIIDMMQKMQQRVADIASIYDQYGGTGHVQEHLNALGRVFKPEDWQQIDALTKGVVIPPGQGWEKYAQGTGNFPQPSPNAIKLIQQFPTDQKYITQFEERYGPGSAAQYTQPQQAQPDNSAPASSSGGYQSGGVNGTKRVRTIR